MTPPKAAVDWGAVVNILICAAILFVVGGASLWWHHAWPGVVSSVGGGLACWAAGTVYQEGRGSE